MRVKKLRAGGINSDILRRRLGQGLPLLFQQAGLERVEERELLDVSVGAGLVDLEADRALVPSDDLALAVVPPVAVLVVAAHDVQLVVPQNALRRAL